MIVVVGAFQTTTGAFTLDNLKALDRPSRCWRAFGQSVALSALTAVIGAVIGGVLAYVLSTGATAAR